MGDYRPRPHDHLVEPLFGGLEAAPRRPDPEDRAWWLRLVDRFKTEPWDREPQDRGPDADARP